MCYSLASNHPTFRIFIFGYHQHYARLLWFYINSNWFLILFFLKQVTIQQKTLFSQYNIDWGHWFSFTWLPWTDPGRSIANRMAFSWGTSKDMSTHVGSLSIHSTRVSSGVGAWRHTVGRSSLVSLPLFGFTLVMRCHKWLGLMFSLVTPKCALDFHNPIYSCLDKSSHIPGHENYVQNDCHRACDISKIRMQDFTDKSNPVLDNTNK